MFFDFLDARIEGVDEQNKDELLDRALYEIFKFILEKNDKNILSRLLESIQNQRKVQK